MPDDLPGLRASHEDRDRVVDTLRVAGGDGRLTAGELDARLPGEKTCQLVSSACRCQESRDLAVIASSSGASSVPAAAQVPVTVAGEMSAPCRARPVTSEFWLRPATYRSVSSSVMNPLDKRPLPIAFDGPGAVTAIRAGFV